MKIKNIDHIVITVKDIDRSIDFYTNVLGMEHFISAGVQHALRFGNQKINLHSYKGEFKPCAGNPEFGSQDLCFIVEGNLEKVKEELEQNGIDIAVGIVDREGACGMMKSFYFYDPDGNLIELSEYI